LQSYAYEAQVYDHLEKSRCLQARDGVYVWGLGVLVFGVGYESWVLVFVFLLVRRFWSLVHFCDFCCFLGISCVTCCCRSKLRNSSACSASRRALSRCRTNLRSQSPNLQPQPRTHNPHPPTGGRCPHSIQLPHHVPSSISLRPQPSSWCEGDT
jgi:hypothetical protein